MTAFDLHLLRHGEPELPGRLLGRTDSLSTPDGIAACVRNVQHLHFERLLASPLRRASEAADEIGIAASIAPLIDPRWQELDFGIWDGRTVAEVSADDGEALARFWTDPDGSPPPGGECWSALTGRVGAAVREIAKDPAPTLIITHGGAMRAALAVLCGFDQRQLWAFDLPYAALLSLRVYAGDEGLAGQITVLRRP